MPGFRGKMGKKFEIIGVVKDFNFESVDKAIEPLIISLMAVTWDGYLNIRINSRDIEGSIKYLEQIWGKYTNGYPFVYFFLDQDFDQNYRAVIRTSRVLFIFSVLSVFIACLGLFGLISYSSVQRTPRNWYSKSCWCNLLSDYVFIDKRNRISYINSFYIGMDSGLSVLNNLA